MRAACRDKIWAKSVAAIIVHFSNQDPHYLCVLRLIVRGWADQIHWINGSGVVVAYLYANWRARKGVSTQRTSIRMDILHIKLSSCIYLSHAIHAVTIQSLPRRMEADKSQHKTQKSITIGSLSRWHRWKIISNFYWDLIALHVLLFESNRNWESERERIQYFQYVFVSQKDNKVSCVMTPSGGDTVHFLRLSQSIVWALFAYFKFYYY